MSSPKMDVDMEEAVPTSNVPLGHPVIPQEISDEDIIAIVTIHSPQAPHVNRDTHYHKTDVVANGVVAGSNVFLDRIDGQNRYSFGREQTRRTGARRTEAQDVYLPSTKVGIRQFAMVPVWESNCWRLQSASETVAIINGAPIQNYTFRTKKHQQPLPHAIYLQQTTVNQITINGLEVDIWLMKSVRDIYEPQDSTPGPLQASIQDVTRRPEDWARNQYLMTQTQVSAKSFRVIGRFTGQVQTAKIFAGEDGNRQLRDREYLTFGKQAVDASVVRYMQTAEVNTIPAIITTTHEDFASYASLQDEIQKLHPGARFAIATKLMRRLFSALDFLHFHGIIHGHVSEDSVLLRLQDGKADGVLLVDYTTAKPMTPGAPLPVNDMAADGKAAMELVEDCCNLWTFRNGPTEDALGVDMMQKQTENLLKDYNMISRVSADYFQVQGGSKESLKGQKLGRLLDTKRNAYKSAQAKQLQNSKRREVAMSSKSKIDRFVKEWDDMHPNPSIGEKQYLIPSLGHGWLDSLVNQLFQNRWDATPCEVCSKFKEFGGDLEEPWQTFEVKKTADFVYRDAEYEEQSVLVWLASCCEVYSDWRTAIEQQAERHIVSQDGSISRQDIRNFSDALATQGRIPPVMETTLRQLTKQSTSNLLRVEETHHVWYHIPSRMFNLTQLQRLASPDRFVAAITEDGLRCENFVELRGEPKIQGCYAQLSILSDFANQLGLTLPQLPDLTPTFPTFDPSDFSQASQARILLARTGMLGFGSIIRHGDQCDFLVPKRSAVADLKASKQQFVSPHAYIPTNFGDMKVLPKLPDGVRTYACPEHWSKFKSAEEDEASAELQQRKILRARGPLSRGRGKGPATSALPVAVEADESPLTRMLKHRENVRAEARLPTKRNAEAEPTQPVKPEPKRVRGVAVDVAPPVEKATIPDVTASFVARAVEGMRTPPNGLSRRDMPNPTLQMTTSFEQSSFAKQNSALFTRAPRVPKDFNESFTVHDETENLEQDWKEVDAMLAQMRDNDDGQEVQGLTAFQYNWSDENSNSETEADPGSFIGGSNSRASMGSMSQSFMARHSRKQQPPPRTSQVFGEPTQLASQLPSQFGGRGTTSTAQLSFGGSTRSHLATPQKTSPTTESAENPAKSFRRGHKRVPSNLSTISEFPDTAPSSPTGAAAAIRAPRPSVFDNQTGMFGNAPRQPPSPERPQETQDGYFADAAIDHDIPPTEPNSFVTGNLVGNATQTSVSGYQAEILGASQSVPTQPATPPQPEESRFQAGYFDGPGGVFGSPGPALHMSPSQSFNIQNGIYSNPANAINVYYEQQAQAPCGDDEFPDTDSE